MLTLSDGAKKELDAYFDGKDKGTIRVFLAPGGCSGPRLSLALDDAGEDDQKEEVEGYTFCINKDLLAQVKSVAVDLTPLGFDVRPEVPLPAGSGGGCGGCCGGCGSN